MALTNHKVVCWNQNGEPDIARIETDDIRIEVVKESIEVEFKKKGTRVTVYDGYMYIPEYCGHVFVKGTPFRLFFFIQLGYRSDTETRFGIAKWYDIEKITFNDFAEFASWLFKISSGAYQPGYSCYYPEHILELVKRIKEVKIYDQGDLVFSEHGVYLDKKHLFMPIVLSKYLTAFDILLRAWESEKKGNIDNCKKIIDIFEKLEKGKKITKEEIEFATTFFNNIILRIIMYD